MRSTNRRQRQRRSYALSHTRSRLFLEQLEDRRLLAIDFTGAVTWVEQGPGPIEDGQVEGLGSQNNPVSGAVESLLAHPTDPDIAFAGAVNGGIWRTSNATAGAPTWLPLTDQFESLSISDLAYDPLDATNQTIFASTGDFRSGSTVIGGRTGDGGIGLLVSRDDGATWANLARDDFAGLRIRSVAPTSVIDGGSGQQVVLVAAIDDAGVYRSVDGGQTFTQISGNLATTDGVDNDNDGLVDEAGELNLPNGSASLLVPDPGNPQRFYAAIPFTDPQTGTNTTAPGVYRSDDAGVTWQQINGTGGNILTTLGNSSRIEMSISPAGTNPVYVSTIAGGVVTGLFRSPDQGANWTQLDTPQTNEGGNAFGLNPGGGKPGGQGRIHFSILADANDANVVYVGGDRQPRTGPDGAEGTADDAWPNSIGAQNFTGRLFQLDASLAAGTQATPITHNFANGTAPHADSRDMVVDGNGDILESDDGGTYRFLLSRRSDGIDNDGDLVIDEFDEAIWEGINGSLRVTEFYGVDYDATNNLIIGGTQDVGSPTQLAPGGFTYDDTMQADGGLSEAGTLDVSTDGIDNDLDFVIDEPGESLVYHYQVTQRIGTMRRRILTDTNSELSGTNVGLLVNGSGGATIAVGQLGTLAFLQQYAVNNIDPRRLVIGTSFLYESTDAGNNLTALGGITGLDGINNDGDGMTDEPDEITLLNAVGPVTAMAYGGRMGGADMADVMYVGTSGGTVNGVFGSLSLRTAIGAGDLTDFSVLTAYPGGTPADISLDPEDFGNAYVLDRNGSVWRTTDAGGSWDELTGNLPTQPFVEAFTTIEYVPGSAGKNDVLLVGGLRGVLATQLGTISEGTWIETGINLPNVRAFELVYDPVDDRLLTGTFGRGAWIVNDASTTLQQQGVVNICGDEDHTNQDDTVRLVRNANNPTLLDIYLNNISNVPDASFPMGAISQINVFGVGGDDELVVDSTNGLIIPVDGIRFNGDGTCNTFGLDEEEFFGFNRGFDRLTLFQDGGDEHTHETVTVGQLPGSGISSINGTENGFAVSQIVHFEELEPIVTDVAVAAFTITSNPGLATLLDTANTITYSGSLILADGGRVTIDNFEPIEFSNKTTAELNAGAGADTIDLANTSAPAGLTSLTVNAGTGNDVVTLGDQDGVATTVNGGLGDDNIDGSDAGTAILTLSGEDGDDVLVGGLGADTLDGGDGDDLLTYSRGADSIDGGAGFDVIVIDGTPDNDTIDVVQDAPSSLAVDEYELTVTANFFTQTIDIVGVLPGVAPENPGNFPSIQEVRINGQAGNDVIRVTHHNDYQDSFLPVTGANQMLRFDIDGGDPNASDHLVVRDDGLGDVTLIRQAPDSRSGRVTVSPVRNVFRGDIVYRNIENLDVTPVDSVTGGAGADGNGRVIVFQPDEFESNDNRLIPTELTDLNATNRNPTIDPGVDGFVPADEDWYLFRADSTGTVRFQVDFDAVPTLANGHPGLPGDGMLRIDVYDSAGSLIAKTDPTDDLHTVGVEDGEEYTLRVRGVTENAINTYTINIEDIDEFGPQVTDFFISEDPGYNLSGPKPADGPTPAVTSLTLSLRDLNERFPGFLYEALNETAGESLGLYEVVGDATGQVVITSVDIINDPVVVGSEATASIVLVFAEPLPDDRFTLTVKDSLRDPVGNLLDGESDAVQPNGSPTLPSGDGFVGGDFVARFTVDSRAEFGFFAGGSAYVDTNGNFQFDPENSDDTNEDIIYKLGFATDNIFAGNFADGAAPADGFDKLAAYGFVNGQFRWLIDTDNDGVPNMVVTDPSNVNGLPFAGNFDGNVANGDEVGLYDGSTWFLDTNHDFVVDTALPAGGGSNVLGFPIVGDFDGDGEDDLGAWTDDTFTLDFNRDGLADTAFKFGFIGVRERPIAADFDNDGIDDIGLWVPDRAGSTPANVAEWYVLISDGNSIVNRLRPNPEPGGVGLIADFVPQPFGPDIFASMGDEFAIPVVGNFDPPIVPLDPESLAPISYTNPDNPFDVNNDNSFSPIDALWVINKLNSDGPGPLPYILTQSPIALGPFVDTNGDKSLSAIDALLLINELNRINPFAEGESEIDSSSDASPFVRGFAPTQNVFADVARHTTSIDVASDESEVIRNEVDSNVPQQNDALAFAAVRATFETVAVEELSGADWLDELAEDVDDFWQE